MRRAHPPLPLSLAWVICAVAVVVAINYLCGCTVYHDRQGDGSSTLLATLGDSTGRRVIHGKYAEEDVDRRTAFKDAMDAIGAAVAILQADDLADTIERAAR